MKHMYENMYYCLVNGAGSLSDQFRNLDQTFMNKVYNDGDSLIKAIMFFTWIFCVIIVAITLVIIPFFFRIDTLQLKAMQYYLYLDPNVVKLQIDRLKEFSDYIS